MNTRAHEVIMARLGGIEPNLRNHLSLSSLYPHEAIRTLASLEDAWTTVGNERFVPRCLAEILIVRRDIEPKEQDQFTVFLANRQKILERRDKTIPLSVNPKQHLQFFNETYLAHLYFDLIDNFLYEKRPKYSLAYKLVDVVDESELRTTLSQFYFQILSNRLKFR